MILSLCKLYFEKYNLIQTNNELLFAVKWIELFQSVILFH